MASRTGVSGVAVQSRNERLKFSLRCFRRQPMKCALKSAAFACAFLVPNIDLAGRIIAHKHCRKMRNHSGFLSECCSLISHTLPLDRGNRFAINYFGRHQFLRLKWSGGQCICIARRFFLALPEIQTIIGQCGLSTSAENMSGSAENMSGEVTCWATSEIDHSLLRRASCFC